MKYVLTALSLFVLITPAITNAQDTVCTAQYQPVCGTENGTYKTYSNGCVLASEGAVYEHEGECTAAELAGRQEGTYTPPAHCIAWSDGCNSCSRGSNGNAMCTLMACMGEPRAGYCKAYADTEVEAPSVSVGTSVSGSVQQTAPSSATEATTTASTTVDVTQGFFARLWVSISTWFGNLF